LTYRTWQKLGSSGAVAQEKEMAELMNFIKFIQSQQVAKTNSALQVAKTGYAAGGRAALGYAIGELFDEVNEEHLVIDQPLALIADEETKKG